MSVPPPFETLKPSTQTIMAYSNIEFLHARIFDKIDPASEEYMYLPKTKKGFYNKKKARAPYGYIINMQYGDQFKGVDFRKPQKKKKKISHFLNQVSILLSLGDINISLMVFSSNIKMPGCKNMKHAEEAIMILWQEYFFKDRKMWKFIPEHKSIYPEPTFLFKCAMKNIGSIMEFHINREKLNYLMNDEKFEDKVSLSQWENTSHPNVNVKLFSKKPKNFKYDAMVFTKRGFPYFIKVEKNPFKVPKKNKSKWNTIIVFSSADKPSNIILSGKYDESMKDSYEFFVNLIQNNRHYLEKNYSPMIKSAVV